MSTVSGTVARGGTHHDVSSGIYGAMQPDGHSHHHSSKFTKRGMEYALPVRASAKGPIGDSRPTSPTVRRGREERHRSAGAV